MGRCTYFSVIPYDLFMLIVSDSLIDKVYELHKLRFNSEQESFWDNLYFLKYHRRLPLHGKAKEKFDEQLKMNNEWWHGR